MKINKYSLMMLVSFLAGFFGGLALFGGIVHESSHALLCYLLGTPFNFSVFQVTYNSAIISSTTNTIIKLSGGWGQTLVALFFFWLAVKCERRFSKWFLSIVSFEITFLTIAFLGVITSFWEGFFNDSYQLYYNNLIIFLLMVLPLMALSTVIIKRWKTKEFSIFLKGSINKK